MMIEDTTSLIHATRGKRVSRMSRLFRRWCSGGGATDIRVIHDNLHTRIIVAGRAGGSGHFPLQKNEYNIGGGGDSGIKGSDYGLYHLGGGPGTQTSGGASQFNLVGTFGFGGNRTEVDGCGGGVGTNGLSGGGGGSGFVFVSPNSLVELDQKYRLHSGKTSLGSNKGDGYIIVEALHRAERVNSFCNKLPFLVSSFFLTSNFLAVLLTK